MARMGRLPAEPCERALTRGRVVGKEDVRAMGPFLTTTLPQFDSDAGCDRRGGSCVWLTSLRLAGQVGRELVSASALAFTYTTEELFRAMG